MKLNTVLAATLAVVAGIAPIAIATPAAAQRTVVHERTVVHHTSRPGYHGRVENRRVCTNQFRHGHRERVCRTVRHRR